MAKMTKAEALEFVQSELARIERQNQGRELRPWMPNCCPAGYEWWPFLQQEIALKRGWVGEEGAICLAEYQLGKNPAKTQGSAGEGFNPSRHGGTRRCRQLAS